MNQTLAIQHGQNLPDRVAELGNLPNALLKANPKTAIVFIDSQGKQVDQNYEWLINQAKKIATGFTTLGLKPKDKILLQLIQSEDILPAYWGALFAGVEPIIVPMPVSYNIQSRPTEQLEHIWNTLDRPVICTVEAQLSTIKNSSAIPAFEQCRLISIENLKEHQACKRIHQAEPDDVAFYTLSSGSTGLSKIVPLTHKNMLSRGIGTNLLCRNSQEDVILSWLPFDHIGNISAYHISPVIEGSKLVYAQKEYILPHPLRWMELIEEHQVTHSWAPNFAFALVSKAMKTYTGRPFNLSSLKGLLSAAELIAQSTTHEFLEALRPHNMRPEALISAFGMAEVCSGITYHLPEPGQSIGFAHIDRNHMTGKIHHVSPDDPTCISFAKLGPVIAGVSIRIVDEQNQLVPEETVGRFQIKGAALMPGYYRNPVANEAFVGDGWFDTGDAAFITQGELVLLGRAGLGIIVNGANLSNSEIEAAAEQITDLSPSFTAACAAFAPGSDKLSLVLFFHSEIKEDQALLDLLKRIQSTLTQTVGIKADYLIPLDRQSIPKTEIGKIQHKRLIQMFQKGEYNDIITRIEQLRQKEAASRQVQSASSPSSEIEQQIAAIWRDVLDLEFIDLKDNFFELGGDSLSLVQAHERLMEAFGSDLTLVDLFTSPTVESLAKKIAGDKSQASPFTQGQARAQARNQSHASGRSTDVAVIGMSCRFPGADDIDAFWKNLVDGVESITFFDEKDLINNGFSKSLVEKPDYVKASPLLNDARGFDAEFFGYSARDAELMDPQHRQFLECAWEAFENAGYDPTTYPGVTGVYAGAAMNTYLMNNILPNKKDLDPQDDFNVATLDSMGGFMMMVANDKDYLTTRVSYKLNLSGPSVNVQTACSTGLVTVHMACQSLLSGETDLFLTGGASIQSPEHAGHLYQPGLIVSPDGHVRSFDAQARGTIFGSGVGAVLLKRLDDAIRDGDHIYAIVKGSAVNNDAGMKVGYMAPSSDGQAIAVAEAISVAGIDPDTIGFVEAHGTGTEIGDPIELDGLTQVFRTQTQETQFCALGSVKTNVGHLQITSGTAGFIKTALTLHHKVIPPLLNFNTPNPGLHIDQSPFFINTEAIEWKKGNHPRRAGVNSLGIGGTNAHAILEEAPELPPLINPQERPLHMLFLSARTEPALKQLAGRYARHFEAHPDIDLANACHTANTGRKTFDYRVALTGATAAEMIAQLRLIESDGSTSGSIEVYSASKARHQVGFLFTGQGSQYINMGRDLYQSQTVFKQHVDDCASLFEPLIGSNLIDIIYPTDEQSALIHQTGLAQPALFTIEYALAKLWQSWGVNPDYVMGHSLGEYAAACIAGVFSLEEAIKLVAARATLMQSLEQTGEMWAVSAPVAAVRSLLTTGNLTKEISIAADNGPESVVVSGESSAISTLIKQLTAQGIRTQKLNTSHAFHSSLMEPMLDDFERVAQTITYRLPNIKLVSNLTGTVASDEITMPQYWRQHIRQSVKFRSGIENMAEQGCNIFIEIGPRPTLIGLGSQCVTGEHLWLTSIKPAQNNWLTALQSMAKVAVRINPNLKGLDHGYQRRKVALPTYPFQHKPYWMKAPKQASVQAMLPIGSDMLLGKKLRLPGLTASIFENQFNTEAFPFLNDHLIASTTVASGACHVAMMLDAVAQLFKSQPMSVSNIHFPAPLIIDGDQTRTVQLIVEQNGDAGQSAQIISFNADESQNDVWTSQHAQADFVPFKESSSNPIDLSAIEKRCQQKINVDEFFSMLATRKINLGPSYRWITSIMRGDKEALGMLGEPVSRSGLRADQLHPGLLDAGFSLLLAMDMHNADEVWLPFAIENARQVVRSENTPTAVYMKLRDDSSDEHAIADVTFCDTKGNAIIELQGLQARRADVSKFNSDRSGNISKLLYEENWIELPVVELAAKESNPAPWLIFTDQGETGSNLVDHIKHQGQTCLLVRIGESTSRLGADQLEISLNDISDTQHLIDFVKLATDGADTLQGIIHLCALDEKNMDDESSMHQAHSSASLLGLIQACLKGEWTIKNRMAIITRGVHVLHDDTHLPNIQQATAWGIGLTINLEHPELNATCIDLAQSGEISETKELFDSLNIKDDEYRIAIRHGHRFGARLKPAKSLAAEPVAINDESTYLITGGTGGLGLLTAAWLIVQGARHIALLSRSAPSPQVMETIGTLKTLNVEIRHMVVDIANKSQLEECLSTIEKDMPPLKGVLHCAGVLDDHLLIDQTWKNFTNVYSAKIDGSWNLHQLTDRLPLDFFVLFSSAASLLGNQGQANYAAANMFMDALATYRKILGQKAISIHWGPWAEVGMAQSDQQITRHLSSLGFTAITPDTGLAALSLCLNNQNSNIGVIDCVWQKYVQSAASCAKYLSSLTSSSTDQTNRRKQSGNQSDFIKKLHESDRTQKTDLIKQIVIEIVQDILGVDAHTDIPLEVPMTDQGFDSLMAVQLTNAIGRRLEQRLPVSLIFNAPTVNAMSEALAGMIEDVKAESEKTSSNQPQDTVQSAQSLLDELDKLLG
ncbi:MAG TPA: hypothetical protein DDY24_09890 [Alcaligenaceae bacterium]|nr:hypothetical protein [Alcaligenaceae bacterium]